MTNRLIIFVFLFIYSFASRAELLIIQSSDNHSKYKRIEAFFHATNDAIENFHKQYPNGQVVFVFNGDYSGASNFSNYKLDRGKLGLKVMTTLAEDYPVLYTFGNHEAFDWLVDGLANDLINEQLEYLHKNGVVNLVSNIEMKKRSQQFITPYYDLVTKADHRIRFHGLLLETFFEKVQGLDGFKPDEVLKVGTYKDSARSIFKKAKVDKVNSIVFAHHEGFKHVKRATAEYLDMLPRGIKLPLSFASHDHLVKSMVMGQSHIIDSGSNFDFTAVVLDDESRVISTKFYPVEEQKKIFALNRRIPVKWEKLTRKVQQHIDEVLTLNADNQRKIPVINESKLTLKKARSHVLGNSLGDALREYGKESKKLPADVSSRQVLGMFNSSSYRNDAIIDSGNLSDIEIREMSPIRNSVRVLKLSGEEVQLFYESLRRFREKEDVYSPQMSSNLKEGPDYKLQVKVNENIGWQKLDPKKTYYLVVDHWLAINGYAISDHEKIGLLSKVVDTGDQFEILKNYLYESLIKNHNISQSCESIYFLQRFK